MKSPSISVSQFSLIFCLIGCADLIVLTWFPQFRWLTKPLILLSLILFYSTFNKDKRAVSSLFSFALLAALIGDIFLLNSGEKYFLFGLSSFLVMQICYAYLFVRDSFQISSIKSIAAAGLLALLGGYMYMMGGKLGDLFIPVLIYSLLIVVMAICALMRDTKKAGYWKVVIGAMFFIISDGFIAWNAFIEKISLGGLIVMTTYIIAQYLIVTGYMEKEIEEGV